MTIWVALISVMGSIVLALLGAPGRDRRERELLAQEIGLLKQLNPGTQAHRNLELIMQRRINRWVAAADGRFASFVFRALAIVMLAYLSTSITSELIKANYAVLAREIEALSSGFLFAFFLLFVILIFNNVQATRKRLREREASRQVSRHGWTAERSEDLRKAIRGTTEDER